MSSAHFDPAVGGDGSTVSDDANPTTGLARGGHWTRFVPALAQIVAVAQWVLAKANQVSSWAANAAASATAAASSATSAATSANSALATLDAFDDRYLGAKSSAPTVDNDGNSLMVGALYWRTTAPVGMYAWDGANWLSLGSAPTSATAVSVTPTGNIASTNVQAAIAELDAEKQPFIGYTPANKAGDYFTGPVHASGFRATGSGFQYLEFLSDHVAIVKKTGSHSFYWRRNDDGANGGANQVELAELDDSGRLWVQSQVLIAGNSAWHAGNFNPSSKQDSIGYTPANKAGDTFTGPVSVSGLKITGTGFQYVEVQSPHVAFIKKSGAYNYYWRRNDSGTMGGANEVELASLDDAGTLSVRNSIVAQYEVTVGTDSSGASRAFVSRVGSTLLKWLHTASYAGLWDDTNGWWRWFTDSFGNLTTRGSVSSGGSVTANGNVTASGAVSGAFGSCGTNATGNKTISSAAPSGGSDGDVWYQV